MDTSGETNGHTQDGAGTGHWLGCFHVLAVVFSAVALGSLVLIGVDLAIGRPAGGDVYIAGLNGAMAAVFWMWRSHGR